jgi:hypothetical protein
MKIYHTDLDTLDKGLENQLMLEAKVKYALAMGHTHIMDANEFLFEIAVEDANITLNEIDYDDENVSDSGEESQDVSTDYATLTTTEIIDKIIRNSLLSSEPIRKEQADTMLVLAQLKHVLANL